MHRKMVGWFCLAVAGCGPVFTPYIGPEAGNIDVNNVQANEVNAGTGNFDHLNVGGVAVIPGEQPPGHPGPTVPTASLVVEEGKYADGDTVNATFTLTAPASSSRDWLISCPFLNRNVFELDDGEEDEQSHDVMLAAGQTQESFEFEFELDLANEILAGEVDLQCRAFQLDDEGHPINATNCTVQCPSAVAWFEIEP